MFKAIATFFKKKKVEPEFPIKTVAKKKPTVKKATTRNIKATPKKVATKNSK